MLRAFYGVYLSRGRRGGGLRRDWRGAAVEWDGQTGMDVWDASQSGWKGKPTGYPAKDLTISSPDSI